MIRRNRWTPVIAVFALLASSLVALSNNAPATASESTAGVQPQSVFSIPFGTAKVDGNCGDYPNANTATYSDYSPTPVGTATGKVFVQHDTINLYVCIEATPGTFAQRFERLYLHTKGDPNSYTYADANDYAFETGIVTPTHQSFHGTGVANGYQADKAVDQFWNSAVTQVNGQVETIEYAVDFGRLGLATCAPFNLAAYHHWVSGVSDDYGWPSNQYFDQPRSWQLAQMQGPTGALCPTPTPAATATSTATATATGTSTPTAAATTTSTPTATPTKGTSRGKIAYVYAGNGPDATSFQTLLTNRGYTVQLVPVNTVLATDFSVFDLIIIANDTGYLNTWGTAAGQVDRIANGLKPILGLGEGGYAFFGKLMLYIGWGNGWHGPQDRVNRAPTAPASYYSTPNAIAGDPVVLYQRTPVDTVGIYLRPGAMPADVVPLGLENPEKDHASLIQQSCRQLWGFSGNPEFMTTDGRDLFINAVEYQRTVKCARPQQPPPVCVAITKTSSPPSGTAVKPGDVIKYTITYTYSDDPACKNREQAMLSDALPPDTIYVPHSATGNITPTVDHNLLWPVMPATAPQSQSFKVLVSETQCRNQRTVVNRAALVIPGQAPVVSNVVTHPVTCPPVGFVNPNTPPYAESDIQINPYPLITGTPSQISVKVTNDSDNGQDMTVKFQTSANRFGIGLNFSAFDTRTVHVPAHSNAIVMTTFNPVSSGHYCIQVELDVPGVAPIFTQRNIDVTEDLKAGVQDTLNFKVRNPTASTANIELVVDNTCPGWTAATNPNVLFNMTPGEVRDAQLLVTPPDPVTLGTACHIDVQGWIGDTMIGGIRKLDVPPVHLPPDVDPPWLEPEITFNPDPPVVGQAGQICVQLQNPVGVARTVTVDFAVADFGAGIPFTLVSTQTFTLPPNSVASYCAPWTPAAGGTLHRCALVTLHQDGQQDETSQHNVDLVRPVGGDVTTVHIPFRIHNPDVVTHTLQIDPIVYGIDPSFHVHISPDPPPVLDPDQTIDLSLNFVPAMAAQDGPAAVPPYFGDISRVDVAVRLDEKQVSGFSVQLDLNTAQLFFPIVTR